jgi:mRNA interferase RelE/StbE
VAEFELRFTRSARKELERLTPRLARKVLDQIEGLGTAPRPPGCRMLTGPSSLWRIRIGDYRVLYEIQDGERVVDIIAVRHRSDAYR